MLKAFLYLLLRDELPAGVVEKLVVQVESSKGQIQLFSNEPLANYAEELAFRLQS